MQLYLNVKTIICFLIVAITKLPKLFNVLALPTFTSKVIAKTLIQKVIFRLWCLQSFFLVTSIAIPLPIFTKKTDFSNKKAVP